MILCFVCRNLFNPVIQDGYEQSESKRETAPRGEQSAVCEKPAVQDHVRGNVSTIFHFNERDELSQYHYKNHLFEIHFLIPGHQCFVSLSDTYQQV